MSYNKTPKKSTTIKIMFLFTICNNSEMFRSIVIIFRELIYINKSYEGWNFNSGNYLFTTDTK